MNSLHPFEDYSEPGNFMKTQSMNKAQVKEKFRMKFSWIINVFIEQSLYARHYANDI